MNIIFFTDGFTPQLNGVATNLEALADALETRGHAVSIFAPKMGGYVDRRERVVRIPSFLALKDPPLWVAAPFMADMKEKIAELAPDIVHIHSPFSMQFLGMQFARRAGVPVVSTYHTLLPAHVHHVKILGRRPVPPRLMEWYSAWTCNLCDHIIAPSDKIKACLEEYGVHRPISLVRNGVPLERFQCGKRGFLRTRFGLKSTDKILLSVGRLTEDKNFGFLVQVLARIAARDPSVYLALVGKGPMKEEFEKQAEELGVRKNLILAGPVDPSEIQNAYADADVFVNASLSETFSLVTLEAVAAGLPAVVADDPALAALVTHGKNGFIVPADADKFAAGVREILVNPALQEGMHRATREAARAFSIETQAEEVLGLYEQLILERQPRPGQAPALPFYGQTTVRTR
jgi:glycosyltransferase involved in cell wall biosynthesis